MRLARVDPIISALFGAVGIALLAALFVFSRDRGEQAGKSAGSVELAWSRSAFAALPGWLQDDQSQALATFLRSCARMERQPEEAPANPIEALGPTAPPGSTLSGAIADWRPACAAADAVSARASSSAGERREAARAFFEEHFTPIRMEALIDAGRRPPRRAPTGTFTGYFEPTYRAARAPEGGLTAAMFARPSDLVSVDLGAFRPALAGQRIAGRVVNGALMPYEDRASIETGALGARAAPLYYLDPDDLFFLQIQGSGRLALPDGAIVRVGYDGQNGHPYVAVGKILVERGAARLEEMSMQFIDRWLEEAPPAEAQALRHANPSYIFFRPLTDLADPALGPLGAEGVQLTPMRSLAVDRRYYAMGAPVWISVADAEGAPLFRQLMIAQDTGGAITGPVRGDIFFGADEAAAAAAGRLNAKGEAWALLPKALAERLATLAPDS